MFIQHWTQKPPLGVRINPAHPLANGLVGCWMLNEGSGDKVYDLSGSALTGTLTLMDPATDWVVGDKGYALAFDGANDYVNVGSSATLDITGPITIAARIKFSVSQTNRGIVGKWKTGSAFAWVLFVDYGVANQLGFVIRVGAGNKDVVSTKTYNDDKWHDVVGLWDGVNVRLYVDGGAESIIGDATAGPINASAGVDVLVGHYDVTGPQEFTGLISKVHIWNRGLTAQEVLELYMNPYDMFDWPMPFSVGAAPPPEHRPRSPAVSGVPSAHF